MPATDITIVGLGPGDPASRTVATQRRARRAPHGSSCEPRIHPGLDDLLVDPRSSTCDDLYDALDVVRRRLRGDRRARPGCGRRPATSSSRFRVIPLRRAHGRGSVASARQRRHHGRGPRRRQRPGCDRDRARRRSDGGRAPAHRRARLARSLEQRAIRRRTSGLDPDRPVLSSVRSTQRTSPSPSSWRSRDSTPTTTRSPSSRPPAYPARKSIRPMRARRARSTAGRSSDAASGSRRSATLRRSRSDADPRTRHRPTAGAGGCPWDRKQTHRIAARRGHRRGVRGRRRHRRRRPREPRRRAGRSLPPRRAARPDRRRSRALHDRGRLRRHVNRKLIRRHPHVFGDVDAETAGGRRRTWDEVKAEERARQRRAEPVTHRSIELPRSMPALHASRSGSSRAIRVAWTRTPATIRATPWRPTP